VPSRRPFVDIAPSEASALQVQPPEAAPLSKAAQAYNLQLRRVDTLQTQLAELDALGQRQRVQRHALLAPLQQDLSTARRAWVLALDGYLVGDELGPRHRSAAVRSLCEHARVLAEAGEADMVTLHDRHSRETLAQLRQQAARTLRQQLEAALGAALQGVGADASSDALWQAARQQWLDERDASREKKQARVEARKTRRPGAAAQQLAELHVDADTRLRRLFRQLASALHPDRAPDEATRLHKTALMSEANAAYERKDLVMLMQIQQRAALVPSEAVSGSSDEALNALTLLLKQQVAALERERAARQRDLALEHRLPEGVSANADSLQAHLQAQAQALQVAVRDLEAALAQVGDVAGLRRCLNRQMG
jgi:hypothetical protein